MDTNLYYLRYYLDGKFRETNDYVSHPVALMEKSELESDGAKNVEIIKYEGLALFN